MRNNIDVRNNKLIHPFLFIYYYILIPKPYTRKPYLSFLLFLQQDFFHDSSFLEKAALSKKEGSFF